MCFPPSLARLYFCNLAHLPRWGQIIMVWEESHTGTGMVGWRMPLDSMCAACPRDSTNNSLCLCQVLCIVWERAEFALWLGDRVWRRACIRSYERVGLQLALEYTAISQTTYNSDCGSMSCRRDTHAGSWYDGRGMLLIGFVLHATKSKLHQRRVIPPPFLLTAGNLHLRT